MHKGRNKEIGCFPAKLDPPPAPGLAMILFLKDPQPVPADIRR